MRSTPEYKDFPFEEIARLNDRLEHLEEVQKYLLWFEFEEKSYEKIKLIQSGKYETSEAYRMIKELIKKHSEKLHDMVANFRKEHGLSETITALYVLKHWHPWSYKYFNRVMEVLRSAGEYINSEEFDRI